VFSDAIAPALHIFPGDSVRTWTWTLPASTAWESAGRWAAILNPARSTLKARSREIRWSSP
jgi:hypothetical protein